MSNLDLLKQTLSLAVPLRINTLQEKGGPDDANWADVKTFGSLNLTVMGLVLTDKVEGATATAFTDWQTFWLSCPMPQAALTSWANIGRPRPMITKEEQVKIDRQFALLQDVEARYGPASRTAVRVRRKWKMMLDAACEPKVAPTLAPGRAEKPQEPRLEAE